MRRLDQRGSMTLYASVCLLALTAAALAAAGFGALAVADHRAGAAADLSALAAATALANGADPCNVAAEVADQNGAVLRSCVVGDASIVVEVAVDGPRLLGFSPTLTGRARAGPSTLPRG